MDDLDSPRAALSGARRPKPDDSLPPDEAGAGDYVLGPPHQPATTWGVRLGWASMGLFAGMTLIVVVIAAGSDVGPVFMLALVSAVAAVPGSVTAMAQWRAAHRRRAASLPANGPAARLG